MPINNLNAFAGNSLTTATLPSSEFSELMSLDATLDNPENLTTEAMRHRLQEPQVGYMELTEKAGAFSCGECRSLVVPSFCANPQVTAYVSEDNGCCNLFMAADSAAIVQAMDWEGGREPKGKPEGSEEDGEESEEDESEEE